jgi:hypothetical protein
MCQGLGTAMAWPCSCKLFHDLPFQFWLCGQCSHLNVRHVRRNGQVKNGLPVAERLVREQTRALERLREAPLFDGIVGQYQVRLETDMSPDISQLEVQERLEIDLVQWMAVRYEAQPHGIPKHPQVRIGKLVDTG